jgi:hypothetical protein
MITQHVVSQVLGARNYVLSRKRKIYKFVIIIIENYRIDLNSDKWEERRRGGDIYKSKGDA